MGSKVFHPPIAVIRYNDYYLIQNIVYNIFSCNIFRMQE